MRKINCVLLFLMVLMMGFACAETVAQDESSGSPKIQIEFEQRLFYVGEESIVPITIHYDPSLRGKFELRNDQGHVYTIALLNGSGVAELNITVCETDARSAYLVGVSGQEESEKVPYRVQPRVTQQMIADLDSVCADLSAGIRAAGLTHAHTDEVMAALSDMLEKDPRVTAYGKNNGLMLFTTTDGLLGFYEYSQTQDVVFGDGEPVFTPLDEAFALYEKDHLPADTVAASNIPITNKKIIYLAPFPEDPVLQWGDMVFPPRLQELAQKAGFSLELHTGSEAVDLILSGDYTDCGMLMIQTHGNELLVGSNTLLTMELGSVTDQQMELIKDYLWQDTKLLFMTEQHKEITSSAGASRLFYLNNENVHFLRGQKSIGGKDYTVMKVTTNYLEEVLRNKKFDNTVAYFSVCHAASDVGLRNLLFERGASAFIGTTKPLTGIVSMMTLEEFCNMTVKQDDGVYMNLAQAVENVYNPPSEALLEEYYQTTAAVGFTNPKKTSLEESNRIMLEEHASEQLGNSVLLYTRSSEGQDRVWLGQGVLEGTVETSDHVPVEGAEVTLYHWVDHDFHRAPDAEFVMLTDAQGTYRVEDLPFGLYAIKAEKNGAENFVTHAVDAAEQTATPIELNERQIVVTTEIDEGDFDSTTASIVKPAVIITDNQEAADKINARLEEIYRNACNRVDELLATSCDDENVKHSYSLMINKIDSVGSLLFITFQESWYVSGAARPNTQKYALAFSAESGEEVGIETIIPEDPQAISALTRLIEAQLADYKKDLFVSVHEAAQKAFGDSSATWMLDGDDLCVIYPANWLTPQFVGNLTVRLPLSDLHGILDEHYLPQEADVHGSAAIVPASDQTDFGMHGRSMLQADGGVAKARASIAWGTETDAYLRTVIFYATNMYNQTARLPVFREGEWYTLTYESNGQTHTTSSK